MIVAKFARFGLLLTIPIWGPRACADQPPVISHMFPPGGQVGSEVEIKLTGKPGNGELQAWSDQNQLRFQFSEKRDGATVSIAPDAKPGIHWVRFYNQFGTTDLRPFFVGTSPEIVEQEPNNRPEHANPISPGCVNGVLHQAGEVDLFAIELKEHQSIMALVQANRELGSPMDGVLELLGPDGAVLIANDDDHANDPRIQYVAAESGTHYLRLLAFPAAPNSSIRLHGSKVYIYRLSIDTDWSDPVNEDTTPSISGTFPLQATGTIREAGEIDTITFDADKGKSLTIEVAARAHHSLLDPVAVLRSEAGKVIQEFDDISRTDPDVSFSASIPESGRYEVQIRDRFGHAGPRHTYSISIAENKPTFTASVSANQFVLGKEKPLEIAVTINRKHGYQQSIEVTATGLPEGVTVAPAVSSAEGETAKSVKLVISPSDQAKAYSGVFQIVAVAGEPTTSESATAQRPNSTVPVRQLWLTVLP